MGLHASRKQKQVRRFVSFGPKNYIFDFRFLLTLSNQLGSTLAYELRQLERDRYPVLLFVHKARGALEVEHVIRAPCSLDELMGQLLHILDAFTRQNQLDIADEVRF